MVFILLFIEVKWLSHIAITRDVIGYSKLIVLFASNFISDWHYENTPIPIYRKFHLQKLKIFR